METTELTTQSQDKARPGADSDWYVRPFVASDEPGLLALYERAFGRPRDHRHWRWKLQGRQAAFNLLWVAAAPEVGASGHERIIGHYGGIPIRIKLNGQLYDAVHAVEAMTDPLYRRKGLLTALGSTAH